MITNKPCSLTETDCFKHLLVFMVYSLQYSNTVDSLEHLYKAHSLRYLYRDFLKKQFEL